MKRFAISFAVAGAFVVLAAQANAQHFHQYHHHRSWNPHVNHQRHHDDLEHRAFHRELVHRDAHRYPMTWRQHARLHDGLEHEAFHDHLEHRAAHRSGAYYAPRSHHYNPGWNYYQQGGGLGVGGRNFSIWFGR